MIVGIGCDIVDHDVTKGLEWASNPQRIHRIFSTKELELFQSSNDVRFLSGRFAAKEAILKCLGTGMKDGIALTDIQILQTKTGKPVIEIEGQAKKAVRELTISSWHVSISHTDKCSIAFVIAERTEF